MTLYRSKCARTLCRWIFLPLITLQGASAQGIQPPSPSGPSNENTGVPYKLTLHGNLPILLSGYIQLRYTDAPTPSKAFQVKRLRFAADAQFTNRIDLQVQIDPTLSPNPLLDAFIQFKFRPEARLRVGQFKVPFSGESLVSDERIIPIERSIIVNKFSPGRDIGSQGRDLGVMLIGNAGSPAHSSLEYAAAYINGNGIYDLSSSPHNAASARVLFHPIPGLSLGGDFYKGKEQPTGAPANTSTWIDKQRQDLEVGLKAGHFVSWAEYLWGHDGGAQRSGGYALVAYRFTQHWEAFARNQSYNALHARRGSITRLYDAGANYYFRKLLRLQLNYGIQKMPANGSLVHQLLAQIQAEF